MLGAAGLCYGVGVVLNLADLLAEVERLRIVREVEAQLRALGLVREGEAKPPADDISSPERPSGTNQLPYDQRQS